MLAAKLARDFSRLPSKEDSVVWMAPFLVLTSVFPNGLRSTLSYFHLSFTQWFHEVPRTSVLYGFTECELRVGLCARGEVDRSVSTYLAISFGGLPIS